MKITELFEYKQGEMPVYVNTLKLIANKKKENNSRIIILKRHNTRYYNPHLFYKEIYI